MPLEQAGLRWTSAFLWSKVGDIGVQFNCSWGWAVAAGGAGDWQPRLRGDTSVSPITSEPHSGESEDRKGGFPKTGRVKRRGYGSSGARWTEPGKWPLRQRCLMPPGTELTALRLSWLTPPIPHSLHVSEDFPTAYLNSFPAKPSPSLHPV